MADLFISYAREDMAFARRLKDRLEAAGKSAWIDFEDIPPTADWFTRIRRGILESSAFVFLISPDSLGSEVCARELDYAATEHKRIIPVLVRDIGDRVVPESAGQKQWISFVAKPFEEATIELAVALDTDLELAEEHTRWRQLAERWSERGRDRSALLRGRELAAAEAWLQRAASEGQPPAALQIELIGASRDARLRRNRALAAVGAVVLVGAVALSVFAIAQRNAANDQRNVANSRALAANAFLELPSDPELSLLLASKAMEISVTPEALDATRQALISSRVESTMQVPKGGLNDVALSPDGQRVATAGDTGEAQIWDARTGMQVALLKHHNRVPNQPRIAVAGVEFSPDGDQVLTAAEDYEVKLWDSTSGTLEETLSDPDDYRIVEARYSPDGRYVITGTVLGKFRVWAVDGGDLVVALPVVGGGAAAIDPRARVALTAGGQCVRGDCESGRLWSLPDGKPLAEFRQDRAPVFLDAEFSPEGDTVAYGGGAGFSVRRDRGSVYVREVNTGRLIAAIDATSTAVDLEYSPDGALLAIGYADGTAEVWDVASGTLVTRLSGHTGRVTGVGFAGQDILVTSSEDGTLRVWDARTGVNYARLAGHGTPVSGLDVSSDDAVAASAGFDGTARTWDVSDTGPMFSSQHTALAHIDRSKVLSPDGRLAAFRAGNPVEIHYSVTGGLVQELTPEQAGPVRAVGNDGQVVVGTSLQGVQISPSGERQLAADANGQVSINDAGGTVELGRLRDIGSMAWDGTGDRVITSADGRRVQIWDAFSGEEQTAIDAYSRALPRFDPSQTVAALSTDGRLAISGALWDTEARIWNADTGDPVSVLRGHSGGISAVAFTSDNAFALTSSSDLTMRVWDVRGGAALATLPVARTAGEFPDEIAAPRDPSALVAASPKGVKVFACLVCASPDMLLDLARERTTRTLSPAEEERFLAGID